MCLRKLWPFGNEWHRVALGHSRHLDQGVLLDAIKGTLDNIDFHMFAMQKTDYVMRIMSTHGKCIQGGKENLRKFLLRDKVHQQVTI